MVLISLSFGVGAHKLARLVKGSLQMAQSAEAAACNSAQARPLADATATGRRLDGSTAQVQRSFEKLFRNTDLTET